MSDENERSVASAGSVAGDPVAWAVMPANSDYCITLSTRMQACQHAVRQKVSVGEYASKNDLAVVPLYLSPTITDEEKRAIGWAAEMLEVGSLPNSLNRDDARTLRSLLERLK